jgi:hypothetical protein
MRRAGAIALLAKDGETGSGRLAGGHWLMRVKDL